MGPSSFGALPSAKNLNILMAQHLPIFTNGEITDAETCTSRTRRMTKPERGLWTFWTSLGAMNFKVLLCTAAFMALHTPGHAGIPMQCHRPADQCRLGLATNWASFKNGWKIMHFLFYEKWTTGWNIIDYFPVVFIKWNWWTMKKMGIASIHTLIYVWPHSSKSLLRLDCSSWLVDY